MITFQTYNTLPDAAAQIRRAVFTQEQGFTEEFDDIDQTRFIFRWNTYGHLPSIPKSSLLLLSGGAPGSTFIRPWPAFGGSTAKTSRTSRPIPWRMLYCLGCTGTGQRLLRKTGLSCPRCFVLWRRCPPYLDGKTTFISCPNHRIIASVRQDWAIKNTLYSANFAGYGVFSCLFRLTNCALLMTS